MLFLHHPYAVNHLAILEITEKSLLSIEQYSLTFKCKLFVFTVLVCMFLYVSYLVIRDLLQVKMGGVDQVHAGVAIVCAAESAPVFGVLVEPVSLLSAALQRDQQCLN